jgi:hypothetical protein
LSNTLCNVAASSSRGLNKKSLLSNRTLKLALQAPEKFRNEISKDSQYPIVWDSGASISITPYKQDFNGTLQMLNCGIKLQDVSEGLRIGGKGTVTWTVMDSAGMLHSLKLPALFVTGARMRLLSTTSLMQTYKGETVTATATELTLSGIEGDPERRAIQVRVNPANNLPMCFADEYTGIDASLAALAVTITTVNNKNFTLSEPQKELLLWQQRLGHLSFAKIKFLFAQVSLAGS